MQLLRFQRHAPSPSDDDAAPARGPESDPKSSTEHPETSAAKNSAAPHRLNVRMDIIPDPTKCYRHSYSMPGTAAAGSNVQVKISVYSPKKQVATATACVQEIKEFNK